jgi:hypothetical protein
MTTTFKLFADKMGGTSASEYIGVKGDLFYNQDTGELRLSDGVKVGGITSSKGCFHKLANITAPVADTVYAFDWYTDATPHINTRGVTVTSANPSRISISTAGIYTVFLEMQIKNTVSANREAYIWLAKNGSDVAETCVKVEIKQGGGTDAYQLMSKQWVLDNVSANDYIEVKFAVNNVSGISLEYTPAQTTPYVRPAIPSATITVTPV